MGPTDSRDHRRRLARPIASRRGARDRGASGLRHRAARRHQQRRRTNAAELCLARSAGTVRSVARPISIARRVPAALQRRNAVEAVAGLSVAAGALTVLWHSIMWQYLSPDDQAAVRAGIDALGTQAQTDAPFAHLTLEPQRRTPDAPVEFTVRARCWPRGDDTLLAVCSPHGPPVTWE